MQNSKIKGQHIVCLLCFLKAFLDVFVHAPGLLDVHHVTFCVIRLIETMTVPCAFAVLTCRSPCVRSRPSPWCLTTLISLQTQQTNYLNCIHTTTLELHCTCQALTCFAVAAEDDVIDPVCVMLHRCNVRILLQNTHTHTHTQEQERHFKEPGKCSDITCTGLVTDRLVLTSHARV